MGTPLPDVENPIEVNLIRLMQANSEDPPLTFPEVSVNYVPGRGLLFSAIAHELILAAILLLSFSLTRTHLPHSRLFNDTIKVSDAKGVVYLPVLGGGGEGNGHAGGSPGAASKSSSPAPSRSSKGRTYPGPQPILSDPENPTNQQQTIIQPAVEKPKILQEFVPLPNMVKVAKPKLPLPTDLVSGKPELPAFHPALEPSAQPPKLALPTSPPAAPIRPAAEKRLHAASEKAVEAPKLNQPQTAGSDVQALVSLSPTPTLPQQMPQIPLGEARGRFAVSPNVNLAPEIAPGSKIEGMATAAAIGQTGSATGNAAGDTAIGAGTGSTGAAGGGGGQGTGVGTDKGSGKGGTGTESARGSGTGVGMGTGPSATGATGAGAGNSTGKGGLPGLTIQGGAFKRDVGNGGRNGNDASREISISMDREPVQTAYGMTITSTADSGGGLPDLGVFAHEKVYTVYLDVNLRAAGHAPSWTLQYARLRAPGEDAAAETNHEGLTPPFPLTKEIPKLNSELIRTYLRSVVVVYAVMDTQGRLQRLAIRQSPEARLNPPILAALSRWVFQPAQLNGAAVPLKVLIGIPLLPYE